MADESDLVRFYQLFDDPRLVQELFNIFEDFRTDSNLKREYPVFGQHLAADYLHMLKKRPSLEELTERQGLVEIIGQQILIGTTKEGIPSMYESPLEEVLSISEHLAYPGVDVHTTARVVEQVYNLVDDLFPQPPVPRDDMENGEQETQGEDNYTPFSTPLDQSMIEENLGNFGRTSDMISEMLGIDLKIPGSRDDPFSGDGSLGNSETSDGDESDQSSDGVDSVPSQSGEPSNDPKNSGAKSGEPVFEGAIDQLDHLTDKPSEHISDDGLTQPGNQYLGQKFGKNYHLPEDYSEADIQQLVRSLFFEKGIKPKDIEAQLNELKPDDILDYIRGLKRSLNEKELEGEPDSFLYQEWDSDIHDYRVNWVRVKEFSLLGDSADFYNKAKRNYSGLIKKVRREFQKLKPEGKVRVKRQHDGDELDLDAVIDYEIHRRMNGFVDDKIYTRTDKRVREIAVALLCDMSGSTQGGVIKKAKESLVVMGEALDELDDNFAVYGFTSNGRDNVPFYMIKDFNDPYSHFTQQVGGMQSQAATLTGAPIRHVTYKLLRQDQKNKILILLSDGQPNDTAGDAIEDTRMALKEAHRYGVKTFCITIDPKAKDYLPRMYGKSSWTVINDVKNLPTKITRIYRQLTT